MCQYSYTRPPSPCLDAEVWDQVCAPPYEEDDVKETCSDECREKEEEIREWGRAKREGDEERGKGCRGFVSVEELV